MILRQNSYWRLSMALPGKGYNNQKHTDAVVYVKTLK